MKYKHNALIYDGKWILVPPRQTKNIIGCKWGFRIKWNRMAQSQYIKLGLLPKAFTKDQDWISKKLSVW